MEMVERACVWTNTDLYSDSGWHQLQFSNPTARIGPQAIKLHLRPKRESQCSTHVPPCTRCFLLTYVARTQQTLAAIFSTLFIGNQSRRPWPPINCPKDILFKFLRQCSLSASNELCAWRNDTAQPSINTQWIAEPATKKQCVFKTFFNRSHGSPVILHASACTCWCS